jgi:hypothetical protein
VAARGSIQGHDQLRESTRLIVAEG